MASEGVLAFLQEHNRPFSIIDIHSGIKGKDEIGKAAVQKALNDLVKHGKMKEKTYGKQKVCNNYKQVNTVWVLRKFDYL